VRVALDERDRPTGQHCGRVERLAVELGKQCGLSTRELDILRVAAAFHDVGKIGIPDRVLQKETPFDADDWAIMKTHSARSQRIILATNLDEAPAIGLVARHHHERWDGLGYPDGLAGEAIPILARIIALVDAYDAMANLRYYRPSRSHAQIMAVLSDERGARYDAHLCDKFAWIMQDGRLSGSA
jgi:HD-GYP domain-containing protein (c-di-GMP phosphodiesterase class II)